MRAYAWWNTARTNFSFISSQRDTFTSKLVPWSTKQHDASVMFRSARGFCKKNMLYDVWETLYLKVRGLGGPAQLETPL
jgi:hypothetical protein